MKTHPVSDEQLHAYIDGELDPAEARRVEAIIAASPELTLQVEQFRADKALIHRIYAPLIEQPLPTALFETLERPRRQRFAFRFKIPLVPAGAIAAAALLVVGLLAYPNLVDTGGDPLVAEAIAAQDGKLRTVSSLGTDTVSGDRVAEETLAAPVKIPNLEKAGYVLKGIAVVARNADGRALQARYGNGAGKSFIVYMRRSSGPDRFELQQRGQTQVCIWQNDELSVVMTGDMSAKEMLKVANLTYSDLNF
ncbi:MAG TPA: zf-HC2 domain-containing protein [Alphaproteobacteria bacterium]|jgi:anti-sigma factor RsiW|nr:zf-HC2 domain-containing protein [Alphaproteobacteria bacterium]